MFNYQPTYVGEPVEETDKLYARAAAVYDENLKHKTLLETALSQIKVPEGGKEYMKFVADKVKSNIDQIAIDAAGGKRWDLATNQVATMAKTLTNDPNITFLQDQHKKYEEAEKVKNALAAKGEEPLFFGDNYETYKPFDKDGKQKQWRGYYAPKGDYDERISEMVKVIKPDEWQSIGQSELPGYFEKVSGASNVKKINEQVNGITERYLGTAEGIQQRRSMKQAGFSDKEIYDQVKRHVQQVGNSFKVQEHKEDLDYDQTYAARLRAQNAKVPPNAINDVFGLDTNEIGEDGPTIGTKFDFNKDFNADGTIKKSRITPSATGTGSMLDPSYVKQGKEEALTEHADQIKQLRESFPNYKVNGRRPTDKEMAEMYAHSLESFGATARTTARIINPDVKKNMSNLSNFDSFLGSNRATVIGGNPKDTKTLRDQIKEQNPSFKFGSGTKFVAEEINVSGFAKERSNDAGGIIGTVTDEKGNTVRVMLPLPQEQQRHFSTVSNAIKSYKEIKSFGRGKEDTGKGVGQRVEDTSQLVAGYLTQAGVAGASGYKFAFRPHRFAEEETSDGSYGSSSGIKQDVRFGLEYFHDGKWHAVIPGDKLYNALSGINVNGHSAASDWSLSDMRNQSLTSFRSDGLIENSLKNQKNRDNQPESYGNE